MNNNMLIQLTGDKTATKSTAMAQPALLYGPGMETGTVYCLKMASNTSGQVITTVYTHI